MKDIVRRKALQSAPRSGRTFASEGALGDLWAACCAVDNGLVRSSDYFHIVAVLAIYRCSTMAQTGVSGPVVVDGESFCD